MVISERRKKTLQGQMPTWCPVPGVPSWYRASTSTELSLRRSSWGGAVLHTSFALACAQSVPPGSVRRVFLIPAAKAGAGVLKVRTNVFPLRRTSLWRVLGAQAFGKKKHHRLLLNKWLMFSVQEAD